MKYTSMIQCQRPETPQLPRRFGRKILREGQASPLSLPTLLNLKYHNCKKNICMYCHPSLTRQWADSVIENFSLDKYFDLFYDANPIFSRENFLHSYRNKLCSKDLISTMAMITAKLIGFALVGSDLDTRIDHLLSANHLELDIIGDSPTLDQMRKAYILAFYEFHQFPGDQSWMRIGRLTRVAYRVGIDKLELLPRFYPDWAVISKAEMQEWRLLWWCIYKIDSYTNLAAGTPYLIDKDFINTALVMSHSSTLSSNREVGGSQTVYLPASSESLWEVIPAITADQGTFLANIHIVTVTAMRDVALVGRIHYLRSSADTVEAFSEAGRQLSALRLALPFGWLNTDRNALAGESQSNHHARLATIFHLCFAHLFLEVLNCRGEEGDGWTRSWQKILENCQNIARAAAQWDSSFCVRMDPALSFVFLTALIFFEVHKKTNIGSTAANLESSIRHDQTILLLLLDQFAKIWTLPRLIICKHDTSNNSILNLLSADTNIFLQCPLRASVNHFPAFPVHYLSDKSRQS